MTMPKIRKLSNYNLKSVRIAAAEYFDIIKTASNVDSARDRLYRKISSHQLESFAAKSDSYEGKYIRMRDCAATLRNIIKPRSDQLSGFSVI